MGAWAGSPLAGESGLMTPELRVYILMGASVLAGALLGAALIRKGWVRAYGAMLAGHVLAAVGLYIAARQVAEMRGLGHVIMLAVFVLPAMLGMVLGGGFIWWRRR